MEPLCWGMGLNARWVAKYSDLGPIEGYISETVQDRRQVSINQLIGSCTRAFDWYQNR